MNQYFAMLIVALLLLYILMDCDDPTKPS